MSKQEDAVGKSDEFSVGLDWVWRGWRARGGKNGDVVRGGEGGGGDNEGNGRGVLYTV